MVAHNVPYVATACHSYPIDFMNKVKKARKVDGPSFIHCLSVCPTGWRVPSAHAIKMGRLAVEAGVFPLYEVEDGKYRMTYRPEEIKTGGGLYQEPGKIQTPDAGADCAHTGAGDS